VELLVHTDDASAVWASPSPRPPAALCQRVLAQQFPNAGWPGNAWHGLLAANGRRSAEPPGSRAGFSVLLATTRLTAQATALRAVPR